MVCKAKKIIGSFRIGLSVYGDYQANVHYKRRGGWDQQERIITKIHIPFKGVLVGGRYIPLGIKTYMGAEDGWRFQTTEKAFVFLVRESFIGKEIMVLPEDIRVSVETYDIPILKQPWPEYARKGLSKEMSKWPRDERGKWLKI